MYFITYAAIFIVIGLAVTWGVIYTVARTIVRAVRKP